MRATQAAELVFVPTPAMGHLVSAVETAKLIIQRDQHISILILIIDIPKSSFMIKSFVDSQLLNNPYPTRLTFIILPPLSNPPNNTASPNFFPTLIALHESLVIQALTNRARADSSPELLGFVLDMFCANMLEGLTHHFKVPSYIFYTSGANLLNLAFHFQELEDNGQGVDTAAMFKDPSTALDVPGFMNQILGKFVPAVFLDETGGASMVLNLTRKIKKSKGIIINTFTELESFGIQSLLEKAGKNIIPPIYPVGPILKLNEKSQDESQAETEESIMKWLDNQPSSSVVFLCFGSMGSFGSDQVEELANGIEKSGHRFVWSLRNNNNNNNSPPSDQHGGSAVVEALPNKGFLDRTRKRGKVIGWAPQVSILGHEAVGGFVSHCGWNSTLESLWFGVPMATWPLYAEQQLNAFELVKELGLAVEIRMDYRRDWLTGKENFVVTAEEIENGVNKLMSLDEETKNRVREMSIKGRKALEDNGGSSYKWLGCFIEDILSNVVA